MELFTSSSCGADRYSELRYRPDHSRPSSNGTGRPDYPKFFLHDLRFNEDGSEKNFIFNTPPFNEADSVTDVVGLRFFA